MKKLYKSRNCHFLIISILLVACSNTEPEPRPEPPTNLIATAISTSQIDLAWDDNSDNETGFKIERRQSGAGGYALLATLGVDETNYMDKNAKENTTYSYRVFAFNETHDPGEYSNEVSSTTFEVPTITDFDGNVYPIVSIGTQVWMAENLKTTKLNDGTEIPLITDGSQWNTLTTPGFSWYDNQSSNGEIYGALYNWYTVETTNVCPSGWHVPTDAEWTTLSDFLGGEAVAGGKLKEGGVAHWTEPNTLATNEFDFTALPGGYRNSNGSYNLIGRAGRWWTSTEKSSGISWYRTIGYDSSVISQAENIKSSGFSIRCVMD